jgi:hypothetical protein
LGIWKPKSRAELLDLETAERMDFAVVYPADANID